MHIGIPKEIKVEEHRVAATPSGVRDLVRAGHRVTVGHDAGAAIGFADDDYRTAGAEIAPDPADVYAAELIYKVKEPQPDEVALLRPGQVLYGYLHLAAAPALARALLDRGVTAIAFETVENARGETPLLAPMSQVAGRFAVQAGMQGLEMRHGGRGVLLAGVPGVAPGRVTVIGGGQVGANAVRVALGSGAAVTVLDRDMRRLQAFDDQYQGRVQTRFSSPETLAECVTTADLVVGAVYVHGRRAPTLIDRDLLDQMQPGAVIVDVSIDQGGIAASSRVTTHSAPFFVEAGIVHYGVANMPGAVARTSTLALANATLPGLFALAGQGVAAALAADPGFALGLNLAGGAVTHPGLAEDLGLPCTDWQVALPKTGNT